MGVRSRSKHGAGLICEGRNSGQKSMVFYKEKQSCELRISIASLSTRVGFEWRAQRDGEFTANLHADCARLSEPNMVRVAELAPADQARLGSDKFQMRPVAQPLGLGNRELAFVDWAGG